MNISIQDVLVIITLLIATWVIIRDFFPSKEDKSKYYTLANKDLGY